MSYLHIERAAEKSTVLFLRPFSVKSTDGLADRLISTQKVKGRKKEEKGGKRRKKEEKGGKTVPVGRKMSPAVPGKERQGEYFCAFTR